MGGSGGRFVPRPRQPASDDQINGWLRDWLRDYNDRDTEAINRHIQVLRDALEQSNYDVLPTTFGGSVSRHTYVDGLSDVDVLARINDSTYSGQSPRAVIQRMAELIQQRLPNTKVRHGDLAVTVEYSDGIEIQVLPAIRTRNGYRIANPTRNEWSGVIHPERFAQKLTQVNQANRGQVIPAVKLTKALAHRLIRSDRDEITGYHIESLAVEAFKNYRGPTDLKSMVSWLTDYSSTAVQQPIRDSTGQSRHVDNYMGGQRSVARQKAAANFRKMRESINSCKSQADIDNLFDL